MKNWQTQLPNILTVFRVILIPLFIWFTLIPDFYYRLAGIFLFTLASLTDYLDGRLARQWQVTSEFGKFLDPLADKFLVISALFALFFLEEQVKLWMILVIIGRDVLITLLRSLAIKQGGSLRTSRMGKAKTMFQMFSIFTILTIILIRTHPESQEIRQSFKAASEQGIPHYEIALQSLQHESYTQWFVGLPYIIMLITTIFTIISGLRYIISNWQIFFPSKN